MYIAIILVCSKLEVTSCTMYQNSKELFATENDCYQSLMEVPPQAAFYMPVCASIPGENT